MSSSSNRPASLADLTGTLMLVGAGKMGGALLEGWLEMGLDPARLVVLEPQPSTDLSALAARGLRLNPAPDAIDAATAIVVAVKPQIAADALATIAPRVQPGTFVVSIMAGRTLAFLQSALPAKTAAVRAMPNTPAAIGRGITVAVANAHLTDRQRALAQRLLAATGAVEWVGDEALMDAVTAVSGSGPAYVFLLAECLARAGVAAGLPAGLAERLARATVAGSGELMARSSADAAALRRAVTSPGGTTAAALEILMAPHGLSALMETAVAAATRRSRELAG
ncbi:MAG TPA: pyrroline-5-carboxylate reductase [Xanthobacteraceae bacterium]|nr:pyrroline-5-carboxylate reductase [Xanthobacteraceae bacterium]